MAVFPKLVLTLALALPGYQRARPPYTIQGHVTLEGVDLEGPLLVGLESAATRLVESAYTGSGGNFLFQGVSAGVYYVTVSVEGFEEGRERVTVPGFSSGIWVYLKRETPVPGPQRDTIFGKHLVDTRQLSIPKDAIREYQKAMEASKEGDHDRSVERLEHAISLAPRFYEAMVQLGRVYIDLQDYDSAIEVFQFAIPSDIQLAGASFFLGYALYQTGQYDAAEDALVESIESDPGNRPTARLVLTNVFLKQQKPNNALDQLDAYIEESPNDPNMAVASEKRLELMEALGK